jgi:type II restriction enzyme
MPRDALKKSHVGIRLNSRSSKMERRLGVALGLMQDMVKSEFGLTAVVAKTMQLSSIVDAMNERYGEQAAIQFARAYSGGDTYLEPDGGFWSIEEWDDPLRVILVAEVKRQGTNDSRKREGKKTQSRGNAIERLGKNMRGIDAFFLGERITPFVCFGEGCDFGDESYILDRVATLNGFFPLNTVFVDKIEVGEDTLKPTSMYFREQSWSPAEMAEVLVPVARRAIQYYQEKYDI